jgi:hypothetical protein
MGLISFIYKYGFPLFLIILHFCGDFINYLAIICSSTYLAFYYLFNRKVDLYKIFLLLVPSIIFKDKLEFSDVDLTFNNNLPKIYNTIIIGPLALSSRFIFSLSVPIKLLLTFNKNTDRILVLFWLFSVLLSIIGLYYSYFSNLENSSGLTVGLRIALSLGIILSPLVVNVRAFYQEVNYILLTSFFLLFLNLVTNHWYFVILGFFPYICFYNRKFIPFILYSFISILFSSIFKLTVILALVFSIIFTMLILINIKWIKLSITKVLIIVFPLILTLIVLSIQSSGYYDLSTIEGFAYFKLLGDRKPIWDASFNQIIHSSFFIGDAGNVLSVYFDFNNTLVDWSAGSHNIFLEIGRQLGLINFMILATILFNKLINTSFVIVSKQEYLLFFGFISVYLSIGLTGQAIIYDGVGALFWLIFSQLLFVVKSQKIEGNLI